MERVKHLLLIDDDVSDVELTLEAFELLNIDVHINVLSDGQEAIFFLKSLLQLVKSSDLSPVWPDLILLDLHLPKYDGMDVLRMLKTTPEIASIPVIVLSHSELPEDINACYALHANGYIKKPSDFSEFIEIVKLLDLFWFKTIKLPENSHV